MNPETTESSRTWIGRSPPLPGPGDGWRKVYLFVYKLARSFTVAIGLGFLLLAAGAAATNYFVTDGLDDLKGQEQASENISSAGPVPGRRPSPADPDFQPENSRRLDLEVTQAGVTVRLVAGRFTPARTTLWFALTHPTITAATPGVSLFSFPPGAIEVSGFQRSGLAGPTGRSFPRGGVEGYTVHLHPVTDPAQPVSVSIKEILVRQRDGAPGNDIVTGPWTFTFVPGVYTADEETASTKTIGKTLENQGVRIDVQSVQVRGSEVAVRYAATYQGTGTIEPLGRPQLFSNSTEHRGSGQALPMAGETGSVTFSVPSGTPRATPSASAPTSPWTTPRVPRARPSWCRCL